jgi:hypothetical protein
MTEIVVNNLADENKFKLLRTIIDLYVLILPSIIEIKMSLV